MAARKARSAAEPGPQVGLSGRLLSFRMESSRKTDASACLSLMACTKSAVFGISHGHHHVLQKQLPCMLLRAQHAGRALCDRDSEPDCRKPRTEVAHSAMTSTMQSAPPRAAWSTAKADVPAMDLDRVSRALRSSRNRLAVSVRDRASAACPAGAASPVCH